MSVPRKDPVVASKADAFDQAPLDPTYPVLRKLRVPVWVYDIDKNRVAFANQPALALWGAETEAELYDRDMSQGMSTAVAQRLRQYQRDFVERAANFTENWTLYPNGKPVALNVIYSGYEMHDGRMAMLCEVLDELRDDPDNLRRSDALLHADVMVTMFEEDGPPLYFNPAARRNTTSTTQVFREMFVNPEDYEDLMFGVHANGEHRSVARVNTALGQTWSDLSVRRCKDPVTGNSAILVTEFDVTDLKTARDEAKYLAETDPLTHCRNRNYLNQRLDDLTHARTKSGTGLLYFDLDHFKQINDSFGHHAGDAVLIETARRIQSQLLPHETLARLGGDEFVLLIEKVADESTLLQRGEHVRAALRKPVQYGETFLQISTSVGAVLIAAEVTDWSEAMRRADIALYNSKLCGRDQCSLFTQDMGSAAKERRQLETDLSDAIADDQFVLFYQPRVNLATGRVDAVEALVRWQHPDRGLLPPNTFIPLCEETGLIERLGAVVLRKACRQAQDWHEQGHDLSVSVNVSPRQFQSDQLIETIHEVAQRPGMRTDKVEFEITESVFVGDDVSIAERLESIHSLGFHIAVDDFGTGYSNLANISRFPLHCIKIDKSFVDQLPTSEPIIRLIVTLAHQIGASVVAEGAETSEQVDILKRLECEQVQGYAFSKPVPVGDLLAVVGDVNASVAGGDVAVPTSPIYPPSN